MTTTGDETLEFSNFAFILHEKQRDSGNIQTLLLQWWANRISPPLPRSYEQGAFWDAILQFEIKHDVQFREKHLSEEQDAAKAKRDQFLECVQIAHDVLPHINWALSDCLRILNIQRPTEQSLIDQKWDLSVLWSPASKFPISYVREHDDLKAYDAGIPPFSLNMNWNQRHFNDIRKLLLIDGESEDPFDETLEYSAENVTKILDKVFLLHYRKGNHANEAMINEAIGQMNSVRQ